MGVAPVLKTFGMGEAWLACIDPRHFLASGKFHCEGADEVAVVSG